VTYKLLALDVDGTLLGEDLVIIDEVRHAIAAAQQAGVIVTLATGRMFRSVVRIARELGLQGPVICYQGAMVRNIETGEMIYHKPIELEYARRFLDYAAARGYHVNAYVDDHLRVAKLNEEARYYSELSSVPAEEIGDLRDFIVSPDRCPTKLVIITEEDNTLRVVADLQEIFGENLYITRSHPRFAEAVNPECSKGAALAALATSLNIQPHEVIAVGDNNNDLPMLEWAGMGIAVGTANPIVRERARYVTKGGIGHGVLEAVEKFILGS
jgi:Cof subfamily protein (haloacid dehalogenase superfamily)